MADERREAAIPGGGTPPKPEASIWNPHPQMPDAEAGVDAGGGFGIDAGGAGVDGGGGG